MEPRYINTGNNGGIAKFIIRFGQPAQAVLAQTFGYTAEAYDQNEFEGAIEDSEIEGRVYAGQFGNNVFMPFMFERTSYSYTDADGTEVFAETPELFIPLLIIEAGREKIIELTAVEGRNGTVKELAGEGDVLISLKGILLGNEGQYPMDALGKLEEISNAKTAIAISNDMLSTLGVADVVVKNVKYTPMPGYEDCQAFTMELISDAPITLRLDDELTFN